MRCTLSRGHNQIIHLLKNLRQTDKTNQNITNPINYCVQMQQKIKTANSKSFNHAFGQENKPQKAIASYSQATAQVIKLLFGYLLSHPVSKTSNCKRNWQGQRRLSVQTMLARVIKNSPSLDARQCNIT